MLKRAVGLFRESQYRAPRRKPGAREVRRFHLRANTWRRGPPPAELRGVPPLLCPREREARCRSELCDAHKEAHGEALGECTAHERRVEAWRLEWSAFAASAAISMCALAVPKLLAKEPTDCQVLVMDDTSVVFQA